MIKFIVLENRYNDDTSYMNHSKNVLEVSIGAYLPDDTFPGDLNNFVRKLAKEYPNKIPINSNYLQLENGFVQNTVFAQIIRKIKLQSLI